MPLLISAPAELSAGGVNFGLPFAQELKRTRIAELAVKRYRVSNITLRCISPS